MSRKNTLLSYFTPNGKTSAKDSSPKQALLVTSTPKRTLSATKGVSPASATESTPRSSGSSTKKVNYRKGCSASPSSGLCVAVLDVVWAKLDGYPWWPAIVCNHPATGSHVKVVGKRTFYNVQFFDKQPSRSWIHSCDVQPFTGMENSDCRPGGRFHSSDAAVAAAARDAAQASECARMTRHSLLVQLPSSDVETSDNEETGSNCSPHAEGEDGKENIRESSSTVSPKSTKRRLRMSPSQDQKRKRVIVADDSASSGDDYKPSEESSAEDENESSGASEAEEDGNNDSDNGDGEKAGDMDGPPKKRSRQKPCRSSSSYTPSSASRGSPATCGEGQKSPAAAVGSKTISKLASFSSEKDASFTSDGGDVVRAHAAFEFLKPENVRDAMKRRPTHPDYDPRTLYVPESFKNTCTPAMRQWWDIKESHFDTVLFFKMGKFYELFHMDADVAVKELALVYMKGNYAHSGFPEISYGRYADIMLQKGYKVARIEQTETPEMMNERCANMNKKTKFDKVVRREICQVTTPGTRTYGFLDGESVEANSKYLLAICEKEGSGSEGSTYGVCFVDTSMSRFYVGQFDDDRHSSRLRTLVAQHSPAQVLYERGKTSPALQQLIKSTLQWAAKEALTPLTEFWDAKTTLKVLAESDYFCDDGSKDVHWPEALKKMISSDDPMCRTPADDYGCAVRALGAIVWYLKHCLMDQEILSMKNFAEYTPVDCADVAAEEATAHGPGTCSTGRRLMVLDAVTLANLDILENQATKTTDGTLVARLDHCCTPFGRRLFRQFLCSPLCDPTAINERLDAVQELVANGDIVSSASDTLRKLPDLERLLSKIHALGNSKRSKTHPDSRAVMFEDGVYSKRKIESFLSALSGFKQAAKTMQLFRSMNDGTGPRSRLLQRCTGLKENGGLFPSLTEHLGYFDQAFDHEAARKAGAIIPTKGYVPEYDEAVGDIASVESRLEDMLDQQKKLFGCKIAYFGTGKNRYQLEVPEVASRKVPESYVVTSQRKGFKRYSIPEVQALVDSLVDAEDRRDAALKDTMRTIFSNFDQHNKAWNDAVQCMALLDVLMSLSVYCASADTALCRPEVVLPGSAPRPFIEIRDGRHPCTLKLFGGGDFIPNDIIVGIEDVQTGRQRTDAELVLITGPNMGGKSTLMRQAGLLVVMAQMGCLVPAETCKFTAVDRIFTRLGANDRIMAGESTFYVELSETSSILHHATRNSLVLLDELGRGTATYDGTAIASAVVRELAENVGCRTLFSTHYHSLVEDFCISPHVQLGHMACMVENEDDSGDPSSETITFLYKFVDGACPKSYGFNAARLAGIPEEVIQVGLKRAREFEQAVEYKKLVRALAAAADDSQCLQIFQKIRSCSRSA